jgi:DNA-binding MarR family transcriptional regulator
MPPRSLPAPAETRPQADNGAIVLEVLSRVERDSMLTQRRLAGEIGIAVGLANAYLKRAARKGLIKVREVPARRFAYYLTPKGFAEKARLTAEYLHASLQFYRAARQACVALLETEVARGRRRLVLVGTGDLAEVMFLSAGDVGAEVVAIVDPGAASARCAGRTVLRDLAELDPALAPDAVVVAAMDADGVLQGLAAAVADRFRLPADALLRPRFPGVVPETSRGRA